MIIQGFTYGVRQTNISLDNISFYWFEATLWLKQIEWKYRIVIYYMDMDNLAKILKIIQQTKRLHVVFTVSKLS